MKAERTIPVLALSIEDCTVALGCGWDFFNEHVAPDLKIVRRGRRKLIAVTELQRWLDEHGERVLDDGGRR